MKKVFQIELEVPEGFENIEPQVCRTFCVEDTTMWSLVSRLPREVQWRPANELHVGKQVRARDYDYEEWTTGKLVHISEGEYRYLLIVAPGMFEEEADWFKICEVEE